ncbi:MAG: L,D-transpeptidase family protein [Gemmatimonadaceae bacterium]
MIERILSNERHMMRRDASNYTLALLALAGGCGPQAPMPSAQIDAAQQLLVVITPSWASTVGTMTRFERATPTTAWSRTESPIPVVVGRTGVAWGVGFDDVSTDGPHKHEGDGKAPAGIFPLDTTFGFAPRDSVPEVLLPYAQLLPTTECVDDTGSAHYNTVVDRTSAPQVDWKSAERMREVPQYKIGVIVGYNASPPIKGRGSCIFLHIWAGPDSHTAGCTAFDEGKLRAIMLWLDPKKRPLLVQLTADEYGKVRTSWKLPAVGA